MRILLVEDEKILVTVAQLTFKTICNSIEYKLDVANCGKEAVQMFSSNIYDLIFMDFNLPDITGPEITKSIRSIESKIRNNKSIIVALTSHAASSHEQICIESGMDDFIQKPLDRKKLSEILKKFNLL